MSLGWIRKDRRVGDFDDDRERRGEVLLPESTLSKYWIDCSLAPTAAVAFTMSTDFAVLPPASALQKIGSGIGIWWGGTYNDQDSQLEH